MRKPDVDSTTMIVPVGYCDGVVLRACQVCAAAGVQDPPAHPLSLGQGDPGRYACGHATPDQATMEVVDTQHVTPALPLETRLLNGLGQFFLTLGKWIIGHENRD